MRKPSPPRYPYNVAPVFDNSPFFFFTMKTRDVCRDCSAAPIVAGTGKTISA